jgi:hypothetical protein
MTREEGLEMLNNAPVPKGKNRVNPSLSCAQGIEIIKTGIASYPPGHILSDLMEKRVYQVIRNQRRPKRFYGESCYLPR